MHCMNIGMDKPTFDGLPQAVALLLEKVNRIENMLSGKGETQQDIKEMLSADEATAYLGVSRSLFYKLTSRRAFPLYKPGGSKIYVKRSDLLVWMQQNRISSQEEIEQEAVDYLKQARQPRKAKRI